MPVRILRLSTPGMRSLANRPTSGDFSFLELGPRDSLFTIVIAKALGATRKLADELGRVLKPDGICVHRVDLNDHLGGCLNNLRFTDAIWESVLFRESGFYANRRLTDEDLLVSGFDLVLRHKA